MGCLFVNRSLIDRDQMMQIIEALPECKVN